jgi:hypothetical protein
MEKRGGRGWLPESSKSVLHTTARYNDLKRSMNELTATAVNANKNRGRH